jgi:hypothetical protein
MHIWRFCAYFHAYLAFFARIFRIYTPNNQRKKKFEKNVA